MHSKTLCKYRVGRIFIQYQYVFCASTSRSPFQSNTHNTKLWQADCLYHSVRLAANCYDTGSRRPKSNRRTYHILLYRYHIFNLNITCRHSSSADSPLGFFLHITLYTSHACYVLKLWYNFLSAGGWHTKFIPHSDGWGFVVVLLGVELGFWGDGVKLIVFRVCGAGLSVFLSGFGLFV